MKQAKKKKIKKKLKGRIILTKGIMNSDVRRKKQKRLCSCSIQISAGKVNSQSSIFIQKDGKKYQKLSFILFKTNSHNGIPSNQLRHYAVTLTDCFYTAIAAINISLKRSQIRSHVKSPSNKVSSLMVKKKKENVMMLIL